MDQGERPLPTPSSVGRRKILISTQVAGSRDGISAFQLDVKELGLKAATLEKALAQAREARLHVLDEMASRGVDEPQARGLRPQDEDSSRARQDREDHRERRETIRGLIADDGAQSTCRAASPPRRRCAQAAHCLANVDVDDEGAVMISGKTRPRWTPARQRSRAHGRGAGGRPAARGVRRPDARGRERLRVRGRLHQDLRRLRSLRRLSGWAALPHLGAATGWNTGSSVSATPSTSKY